MTSVFYLVNDPSVFYLVDFMWNDPSSLYHSKFADLLESGGGKGDPLKRTCRWFGGFRREFSKRSRVYKSDIMDSFNLKCLVSVGFIFLACFIPVITFGAILSS